MINHSSLAIQTMAAIDFSYVEMLSDGDVEFIRSYISTFESTTTGLLDKMEQQLSTKDFEGLSKTAHQLKPSLEMLQMECSAKIIHIQHHPEDATMDILENARKDCTDALKQLNNWAKEKGA